MESHNGLFQALLFAVIASAGALTYAHSRYVPFQVDGGWYAYPALALYEQRDPGDNQRTAEELLLDKPGRKARFYWDSRRNLFVLPTLGWMKLFGASLRSMHAYGLAQLIVFAAAAW